MKKKILFIILLAGMIILPISVSAKTQKYNTLDFEAALAEEEIEPVFKSYKPDSDAITIYLFRGKGCGYCRAFLTFMNSITDEYGKYFKIETYEVWNDSANSALMSEVSSYLGEPATGVPYVIIGDKVFGGYSEEYNEKIKEAIKELYDTKKSKRYDVFKSMKKENNSLFSASTTNTVIWNLLFTFISTIVIMSFINIKFKELSLKIDDINLEQVNEKTSKNKEEKRGKK